jgi:hypothetical protein
MAVARSLRYRAVEVVVPAGANYQRNVVKQRGLESDLAMGKPLPTLEFGKGRHEFRRRDSHLCTTLKQQGRLARGGFAATHHEAALAANIHKYGKKIHYGSKAAT